MFVVSLSSKKVKKVLFFVVCCISAVFAVVVLFRCFSTPEKCEQGAAFVGENITDSSQILAFVSRFGWEVEVEPDEIREVIIPVEFDDVYNNYNVIQIKQGYDLKKYAGERVKRWTYTVKNYPGYEDQECIKINVLVCDREVIGGDVCSVRLDGFMHGFNQGE